MKADRTSPRSTIWAEQIATLFGIGHIPWAPGTWASLAATLLWWLMTLAIRPRWQVAAGVVLAGIAIAVGIPASSVVSRKTRLKDPQFVVIDEVAGQLISFVAVPASWKSLLLGFILFRGFDIVKPPPAYQLEQLPEGFGIVMDDVAAGVYAFGIMQILLHIGLLPK